MNETRFLKTVTFGGYDKTDTDNLIKSLFNRISRLESELRVTKFSLDQYRNGDEPQNALQTALDDEREKLAEMQSLKETISIQLQSALADNTQKEEEIANLKYSVSELEHSLADADMKLASMSEKDDAAVFGAVFAAAKKSASEIISEATKKANDLDANSKKLAENIVAEANNKAADIVYEAEVYAAEMTAEVDSTQLESASNSMKSAILDDVNQLSDKIASLRKVFEELKNYGDNMIQQTETTIAKTQDTLIRGGVPSFNNAEPINNPDLPEKPVYEPTDYYYIGAEQERNFDQYSYDDDDDDTTAFEDLEDNDTYDDEDDFDLSGLVRNTRISGSGGVNLKALDKQAEEFMGSIKKPDSDKNTAQSESEDSKPPEKKNSDIDLSALAAQAAELDDNPPKKDNKKSKSIDLSALAEQAAELDDAPPKKENKKSKGIDLAALAAQAAALDE